MYDCLIIHYAEIATKGRNRPLFERTLMDNIRQALSSIPFEKIKKYYGRLVLYLNQEDPRLEEILLRLQKVFGISSLCPARATSNMSIEDIKTAAESLVNPEKTLNIKCRRSYKAFPLTSPDVAKEVGKHLQQKLNITVDYVAPEQRLFIEITEAKTFLYTSKIKGPRGLPIGVSGKVIILLSGGIDSPVAAYHIMRRGCVPVFVHFHSYPHTSKESLNKAKELVNILSPYTPRVKLYLVPFLDIQKKIMMTGEKAYRVLLYRRYMLRIAERIAFKENAPALVTGDNLGQVASQTITNLRTVEAATTLPVFRPLLTWEKQEIIDLAKQIGTYETSIQPHEDCCSLFVPDHPATVSTIRDAEGFEARLGDMTSLIHEALEKAEKITNDEQTK